MAATFSPFVVDSKGCRLAARSYAPSVPAHPGAGVVLLHGFLSSADMYDVPGREEMSLARHLQREGLHVVSYDQRGGGGSEVHDWAFGLHEHALVDLPAVIDTSARLFGFDRIVFVAHSLGGTIFTRYLQAHGRSAGVARIAGAVAIASPAFFDEALPPWRDFARRGRAFVESMDRDRDLIMSRAKFAVGQALLDWPRAGGLLSPGAVGLTIRAATTAPFLAAIVKWLPIPTLTPDKNDFDGATFMYLLRSRALHQGSQQLLLELFDQIGPAAPAGVRIDLDVLCVGSTLDRLVPLRTVEGLAGLFARARIVDTERAYGQPSGHAGYFFKRGLWERVYRDVTTFVKERASNQASDFAAWRVSTSLKTADE